MSGTIWFRLREGKSRGLNEADAGSEISPDKNAVVKIGKYKQPYDDVKADYRKEPTEKGTFGKVFPSNGSH